MATPLSCCGLISGPAHEHPWLWSTYANLLFRLLEVISFSQANFTFTDIDDRRIVAVAKKDRQLRSSHAEVSSMPTTSPPRVTVAFGKSATCLGWGWQLWPSNANFDCAKSTFSEHGTASLWGAVYLYAVSLRFSTSYHFFLWWILVERPTHDGIVAAFTV